MAHALDVLVREIAAQGIQLFEIGTTRRIFGLASQNLGGGNPFDCPDYPYLERKHRRYVLLSAFFAGSHVYRFQRARQRNFWHGATLCCC